MSRKEVGSCYRFKASNVAANAKYVQACESKPWHVCFEPSSTVQLETPGCPQVCFDAGTPGMLKQLFAAMYLPEKSTGLILPQQATLCIMKFCVALHALLHATTCVLGCFALLEVTHVGTFALRGIMPPEQVVERFQWADVACRCLLQTMGHTRVCQSVLCNSQGSDSDFSGGAAAWECAAQMIQAAGRRYTLPIDLTTRTACDPRQLGG